MKLTLDHTQRLNLHALLDAQRADVGSIRAIWAVQDKLTLDADEEKAVELNREMVAGQERVVWNSAIPIPAKELEFTDPEIARIKAAIQTWDSYGVNADRCWLEPGISPLGRKPSIPDFPNWKSRRLRASAAPVVRTASAGCRVICRIAGRHL